MDRIRQKMRAIAVERVARRAALCSFADTGQPSNIDDWARGVLYKAFTNVMGRIPSRAEMQLAQGVAWIESRYGRGWQSSKNPDGRAVRSNNWGAIQCCRPTNGQCPQNAFMYTDSYPTSSGKNVKYQICFKAYQTPVAGAEDLVKLLFVNKQRAPLVEKAAQSGSIQDFSAALYDTHYYGGFGATRDARIAHHAQAMTAAISRITSALGEQSQFGQKGNVGNISQQEILDDYNVLMRELAASTDCGPVERIVRRALNRKFLPTSRVLLQVDGNVSMPLRVRYARILASALREELDAEVSIHHHGNRVELECDVSGPAKSVLIAVDGLSEGVAGAFAEATNSSPITCRSYKGLSSVYPIISPDVTETNFRKFAFETMVSRYGI